MNVTTHENTFLGAPGIGIGMELRGGVDVAAGGCMVSNQEVTWRCPFLVAT